MCYVGQDARRSGKVAAGVVEDATDLRMFEEQSKIILKLSKEAPGVFLGRCANFVLAGQKHAYSFFIYADDSGLCKAEGEIIAIYIYRKGAVG